MIQETGVLVLKRIVPHKVAEAAREALLERARAALRSKCVASLDGSQYDFSIVVLVLFRVLRLPACDRLPAQELLLCVMFIFPWPQDPLA